MHSSNRYNRHIERGKRRRPLLAASAPLFFLLFFLSIAALPAQQSTYPVEITDSLGNTVRLEEKPERVVLAGKATLLTANAYYLFEEAREAVVAIGKTNQGLGNFLPYISEEYERAKKVPHQVGPEQILARKPDLVILKDFMYSKLGKRLSSLGVPVLSLSLESPAEFRRDIRILGTLLNEPGRAEEIVNLYDERLREIQNQTDGLSEKERPNTLLLYYSARGGETSFNIAPKSWIQTFQVEAAGGDPVWTDTHAGRGWMTVNFEQIAAWNPEHIFITSFHSAPEDYMDDILGNPQWRALEATKEGNVKAVPADFYSWAQPDTRWILGLQWMATQLHPELFPQLDIAEETRRFYLDLYDIEEETYEEVVLPRLEEELMKGGSSD
jgi:iron complex transport system substrate-binding protein